MPQLCRQAVFLTGGLTLIAITSLQLTLVMLATLPILIFAAVFFGRRLRGLARQTQDQLAGANTIVEETLQAIASVKAFANEAFELRRYQTANNRVLAAALGTAKWRAVFVAFFIIALFGGMVIVLWFGAGLMQRGAISAGELTRFVLYTTFVAGAMGQAAELFTQVQKTVGATQRVRELLREPTEMSAESIANPASGMTENLPVRLRGEVVFEQVDFRYPARPEIAVLRGLSPAGAARRAHCPCGTERRGQIHDHRAVAAILCARRRGYPRRRPRCARISAALVSQPDGHRAAGRAFVWRHHRGEYRLWKTGSGCHADRRGGAPRQRRRFHRVVSRWLRYPCGRPRDQVVRWAAPTRGRLPARF